MNITKHESKYICEDNGIVLIRISYKHYSLGIKFHEWGIRVMLIWWHVFLHFDKQTKESK